MAVRFRVGDRVQTPSGPGRVVAVEQEREEVWEMFRAAILVELDADNREWFNEDEEVTLL